MVVVDLRPCCVFQRFEACSRLFLFVGQSGDLQEVNFYEFLITLLPRRRPQHNNFFLSDGNLGQVSAIWSNSVMHSECVSEIFVDLELEHWGRSLCGFRKEEKKGNVGLS